MASLQKRLENIDLREYLVSNYLILHGMDGGAGAVSRSMSVACLRFVATCSSRLTSRVLAYGARQTPNEHLQPMDARVMTLPDGLYELLITHSLAAGLDTNQADVHALQSGASEFLGDAIARQLTAILDDMGGDEGERSKRQLDLVNALLVTLRQRLTAEGAGEESATIVDLVAEPLRVLKAIHRNRQFPVPPEVSLATPWLFTAGKGSPSLLQEIRRELASADQVDILVSFITVSGVRKLQDVLQQITALSAHGRGATRIRILTTTYTGATEARALDELAHLPGCEVRVSLDGRRTRLHAKAWLFHRKTGFGSAYVGSANLSGAALNGGLEWTVKLTQRAQEPLFARAIAHFETLWEDNEFQRYDPDNADHRRALAVALGRESFGSGDGPAALASFSTCSRKPISRRCWSN